MVLSKLVTECRLSLSPENAAVQLEEKAYYLASVMSNLLSICNPVTWRAIDKPDWSFTLLQSRQQDQINVDSMNNCRLFAICNMKNLALGASVEHEIEPRFSRRGIVLFLWECAQMAFFSKSCQLYCV
jgi:hypothetical protein